MSGTVIIGITGGIGSGKSYVASLLRKLGVPVYDCDTRAKQLNNTDEGIRKALLSLVGESVYDEGGLVKPVLAKFLFSSKENAEKVNGIVHPVVRRDFQEWVQEQDKPIVAMESAILYESGFQALVHHVLMVDASVETRIARAMQRDQASREMVESRIRMQNATGHEARFHIHNEGLTDAQITEQLKEIINSITTLNIK